MDVLDRQLAARPVREKLGCTIRTADVDRARAVAARHGYALRTDAIDEPGCTWAEFWPSP